MKKIDMVIITYNPEIELLTKAIQSMQEQVRKIYIIDNTPIRAKKLGKFQNEKIEIIYLDDNMGIAYAQNIGIKKSLENKSDFIVLSDQDTIYPDKYVENMLKIENSTFDKVIAFAPLFKDIVGNNENEGFITKGVVGFKKINPQNGLHEVFQTIASGKILNTKYLEDVGLMDEDLFIDWVDLEWCWRAGKKGYRIIGNADVVITHQLGDKIAKNWYKDITLRSPIRHYYITRNAFYLSLNDKSLDKLYKVTLFFKAFESVK
jgi:rhamnosyltransferase